MITAKVDSWTGRLGKWPFFILAFTMIVPYYWMFIGAFKPVPELVKNPPTFWVENPTFNNFFDPVADEVPTPDGHVKGLFQRFEKVPGRFARFFGNSVFISTSITVLSLLLGSLAAYVLAKHKFPGRNVIFLIILGSMMVPWQVTIIPNFLTMKTFGWLNSYSGYIVPALQKAFVVFFLRQYIMTIPDDLLDAARIDGAGELRIWWRIILPLIGPALTAMAIFVILSEWNNFLWPLIIVQDDTMATLPIALARLNSSMGGPLTRGVMMAASLLTSLPTLIIFLIFQKQFVQGIALTGIK